jgi:hypothetical protein
LSSLVTRSSSIESYGMMASMPLWINLGSSWRFSVWDPSLQGNYLKYASLLGCTSSTLTRHTASVMGGRMLSSPFLCHSNSKAYGLKVQLRRYLYLWRNRLITDLLNQSQHPRPMKQAIKRGIHELVIQAIPSLQGIRAVGRPRTPSDSQIHLGNVIGYLPQRLLSANFHSLRYLCNFWSMTDTWLVWVFVNV